ncbi:hypothetical protein [Elizabethkingia miricola]|uniref:hypothetical protein n=1 Tax=Elizabethkingia miricola TaxID=172045 RepID=UPI001409001D|nr:hypothetical protein [Elizabethkingia miricola]NHQ66959.1 hypothetical protein [Elizabethkingia miricola]NHQ70174.1 hypothetical protein [Elizabethkingia miricola]NHQ77024.1 hypothetical protein [Elizabethkingia miricola]
MNELKIQIPEGFQIGAFDKVTGVVKFEAKPKEIKERIKTFNDVLQYHGIKSETFAMECVSLTDDEIAYKQIKLIASALNEGWVPDWNDRNQTKYYPWFRMGSSSGGFSFHDYGFGHSASYVGSRLCYKSSELAKYAGTQFISIYKKFTTL